eukprot:75378-Rhodomonas_salina.1
MKDADAEGCRAGEVRTRRGGWSASLSIASTSPAVGSVEWGASPAVSVSGGSVRGGRRESCGRGERVGEGKEEEEEEGRREEELEEESEGEGEESEEEMEESEESEESEEEGAESEGGCEVSVASAFQSRSSSGGGEISRYQPATVLQGCYALPGTDLGQAV